MSLKMILIFAELEREQIGERTKKCLQTRANSGLWNSGPILGYDIDKNRPGVLKVNENEKKVVNHIFKTYLKTTSINKTRDHINSLGFKTKSFMRNDGELRSGHTFYNSTIHRILTNKLYNGMIEINKSNKRKEQSLLEPEQQYRYVNGRHEAIIANDVFSSVQGHISTNFRKKKTVDPALKHLYLLDGLLYCVLCNFPMKKIWGIGRHDKPYFYYTCICQKSYIRANQIEDEVVEMVRKYVFGNQSEIDNQRVRFLQGAMDKNKLSLFIRRLPLSIGIHRRNILREIIQKVIYKENYLDIAFK